MSTGLNPIDSDATTDSPFVRVYADTDNQRAVIALDAVAVDALITILDSFVPYDLTQDPGVYGVDQDTADRVSAVRHAMSGPLLKMQGWL